MFEIDAMFVPFLILGLTGALVSSVYFYVAQRRLKTSLSKVERALAVSNSGAVGMGQRMLELQSMIEKLRTEPSQNSANDTDTAYLKAKSMISQGLSDEIIAASCNIALSEIRLMRLVHAKNKIRSSVAQTDVA